MGMQDVRVCGMARKETDVRGGEKGG